MSAPEDRALSHVGDVVLQSSAASPDMRLTWKTCGRLDEVRDKAILDPTSFGHRVGAPLPMDRDFPDTAVTAFPPNLNRSGDRTI